MSLAGWALVVHGGAGVIERERMTAEKEAVFRAGLASALEAGRRVLADGGAALDAVAASVRAFEDDPAFNAGRGAVFTHEGKSELDAAIMDGQNRRTGAVAQVTRTRNPIDLARRVMDESPHVLLAGLGADAFSREQGLEQVDPSYFRTEEQWQQYEELKRTETFDRALKYGTVGAVARDNDGHLAAATSTGGLTGKRWGRVGDTPIAGAGTWADDRSVAVSSTGTGEEFIRIGVAHEIEARVRLMRESPLAAARAVIDGELTPMKGSGGVIVMGREGPGVWAFNSPGMYRARVAQGHDADVAIFEDGSRAEP